MGILNAVYKAILTAKMVIFILSIVFACSAGAVSIDFDMDVFPEHVECGELERGYFSVKDIETEEVILRTARRLHVDDEYLNQHNELYVIEEVEEDVAWARSEGEIELSDSVENSVFQTGESGHSQAFGILQTQHEEDDFGRSPKIGVYHSHGAEAYVPSDGDAFVEEGGGILQVGEAFVEELEQNGMHVIHSLRTHVPHDANAYNRSRRTVEELIKDESEVLFDLHRDAVPREEYKEVVNGEEKVQVQFVVGRQNQNAETIRSFAEALKSTVDEDHPGLVKGILMASGNYNQDMSPRTLLVEVGTHESSREGAVESAEMMAGSVAGHFADGDPTAAVGGEGEAAGLSIFWLVAIVLAGIGMYLLISTEDTEELKEKIRRFFGEEFQDILGRGKDED